MDSVLALPPGVPGLIPGIPEIFSEKKLFMLLRLIDIAAA